MEYYITKYALSKGIYAIKANEINEISETGFIYIRNNFYASFKLGRDIHENKEDAIKAANEMKNKKIKALLNQIAKLKNLSF